MNRANDELRAFIDSIPASAWCASPDGHSMWGGAFEGAMANTADSSSVAIRCWTKRDFSEGARELSDE
jgi:hypothetical protein